MLDVLGYIYQAIVRVRNSLYDRRILEVHDLGARTISVGNITTGGTGKTPLVAYIAGLLAERGEKVCILTRGYGREDLKSRVLVSDGVHVLETDPRRTGDEPLELANKLLGKAVVIADANRVAAAEWARRKFGITAFVLDDGFQHRKAKRDVDIVCIDATNPFGGGKVLPAGRLRESPSGLSRADAVVITRVDLVDDESISDLRSEILNIAGEVPTFAASTRIAVSVNKESGARANLADERPFAFCGIGNPDSFFALLHREGIDLAGFEIFPDHHNYSHADIKRLESKTTAAGGSLLLTTAKDAVKLSELRFDLPCFVAETTLSIQDADDLAKLL